MPSARWRRRAPPGRAPRRLAVEDLDAPVGRVREDHRQARLVPADAGRGDRRSECRPAQARDGSPPAAVRRPRSLCGRAPSASATRRPPSQRRRTGRPPSARG